MLAGILIPPIPTLTIVDDDITIIDQTLLPAEERRLTISTVYQMWEAIRSLRIRGAPAIGIAAAFGLDIAARASQATARDGLLIDLQRARDYLAASRPTAVNLTWAIDRVMSAVSAEPSPDLATLRARVRTEAQAILDEDLASGRAIGEHGAALLRDGAVLTHCNAGGLATSGYGTALAPIYLGHERGLDLHVYAGETRPLLQGARLTAWELSRAGVPVTVVTDSMAATVLSQGHVQAVIVGTDRVAANGDVANKIGTLGLAIIARAYDIPFYVAVPTSTIDLNTPTGAHIPIEERDPAELTHFNNRLIAPATARTFNPAFDITPATLVTAFITEHGIIHPPFPAALAELGHPNR